jgi:hypothetical protein
MAIRDELPRSGNDLGVQIAQLKRREGLRSSFHFPSLKEFATFICDPDRPPRLRLELQ